MTTHFYSLIPLAADWGAECGESTDVVLGRLVCWAAAGGFPDLAFTVPVGNHVSSDDLLDAWLCINGKHRPGRYAWEIEEARKFLGSVLVSGSGIGSFCKKVGANPPTNVLACYSPGIGKAKASLPPEPPAIDCATDGEGSGAEGKAKPDRNAGRPPGAGSFADADAPLVEEMHQMIKNDSTLSTHPAAMKVAGNAAGYGTLESKAKRLTGRYKKKYRFN